MTPLTNLFAPQRIEFRFDFERQHIIDFCITARPSEYQRVDNFTESDYFGWSLLTYETGDRQLPRVMPKTSDLHDLGYNTGPLRSLDLGPLRPVTLENLATCFPAEIARLREVEAEAQAVFANFRRDLYRIQRLVYGK